VRKRPARLCDCSVIRTDIPSIKVVSLLLILRLGNFLYLSHTGRSLAGITLAQAQAQLDAYLAAEVAVLGSQSYEIAGRMVTPEPHANAPHHPPAANVLASHAAEKNFDEKEKRFANIIGVEPTDVNVKAFKSRCGSCNVKDRPIPLEDHHGPARLR
jgi:hypothetical protein